MQQNYFKIGSPNQLRLKAHSHYMPFLLRFAVVSCISTDIENFPSLQRHRSSYGKCRLQRLKALKAPSTRSNFFIKKFLNFKFFWELSRTPLYFCLNHIFSWLDCHILLAEINKISKQSRLNKSSKSKFHLWKNCFCVDRALIR